VQVPAVAGWLRPVVLLPVGALAGLPAAQVEALLAHELAHIRRHDYFVNMLQGVAEALLFYHPAVWWVSGHIRAEREHCCDDAAVAVGGDVLAYANALIELESRRAPRAAALVAANHGSLADRVRRLLGQPLSSGRAFPGPAAVVTGMLLLAAAWGVFAQSAQAPRFEVASVKRNGDPNVRFRNMRPLPGGRLSAVNATAQMLILNAYGVQAYQLIGGPQWIDADGFDIEAKGNPDATREQVLLMLRSLLEDRFQFRFRRETRDLPVYALAAARSGAKLPPPKAGGCFERNLNSVRPSEPAPGQPAVPCGSPLIAMGPNASTTMSGGNVEMKEFVRGLQMILRQPVLDRTGITDRFDVDLKFTRDDITGGLPGRMGGAGPDSVAPAPADALNAPPSILTALQEQLGLKLEKSKGPVEVFVIERLERPSAN
jgi:bla regulator protein blaR1